MVVPAVGEEACARHIGHVFCQALGCHHLGVDIVRQLRPGEEAAVRVCEGDFLGEVILHGLHHYAGTVAVDFADLLHMCVNVKHFQILGNRHGTEGGGLQHGCLG